MSDKDATENNQTGGESELDFLLRGAPQQQQPVKKKPADPNAKPAEDELEQARRLNG